MTTELTAPNQQVIEGKRALKELKALVQRRPDKLVISGKQYLYFSDWQILGAFFGITASVVETKEINRIKPVLDGKLEFLEVIGFTARAIAMRDQWTIRFTWAWMQVSISYAMVSAFSASA